MQALQVEVEDTPLQSKLNLLADMIAKFALYLASFMIIILAIFYFAFPPPGGRSSPVAVLEDFIKLVILAVTIVVVAVPEGLPLAVTLSLAQATLQMLKDNNLVRNLAACETMGNATTICSDKTGTLTLNKMSVVRASILNTDFGSDNQKSVAESLTGPLKTLFALVARATNVNSTAELVQKGDEAIMTGSKTEIALLNFFTRIGYPFMADRNGTSVVKIEPFSSERKRASCLVEFEDLEDSLSQIMQIEGSIQKVNGKMQMVFVKGAAEMVLQCCNRKVASDGSIQTMTADEKKELDRMINDYADGALRTISCAFAPVMEGQTGLDDQGNVQDSKDLIFCAMFGIMDPLRPEVPGAVMKCQKAGVVVRMVTGDSKATATAIAKSCGILSADGLVLEGPVFRCLSDSEMDKIVPKLQVLARSSPLDKQILVKCLKRLGETVAVTGDGTNDAPALAQSDVGFAMVGHRYINRRALPELRSPNKLLILFFLTTISHHSYELSYGEDVFSMRFASFYNFNLPLMFLLS